MREFEPSQPRRLGIRFFQSDYLKGAAEHFRMSRVCSAANQVGATDPNARGRFGPYAVGRRGPKAGNRPT